MRSLFLLAAAMAAAQTPPAEPARYPSRAELPRFTLAAEYLGHTFTGRGGSYFLRDYLVIDVAVYPPKGERPVITQGQFSLRINGSKRALLPQPPPFVAASLKYEDWEMRPTVVAAAGIGDAGVVVGRPQVSERFPGDPRPQQTRLPHPPSAPPPEDRSGLDKEPPPKAHEVAVEEALPEGPAAGPIRGFLYFPYKRKLKDIKKLELLYNHQGDSAVLKLSQ